MRLQLINERLDHFQSYLGYFTHTAINNATSVQIRHPLTFDQWLYSKHMDKYVDFSSQLIPPMTDPLSRYWDQPDQRLIYIDNDCAYMYEEEFNKLANYSHSQPSGVYIGKMWKRQFRSGSWNLAWYGPHENVGFVSNNYRDIIILPKKQYNG